jgi:hypothetical protein
MIELTYGQLVAIVAGAVVLTVTPGAEISQLLVAGLASRVGLKPGTIAEYRDATDATDAADGSPDTQT